MPDLDPRVPLLWLYRGHVRSGTPERYFHDWRNARAAGQDISANVWVPRAGVAFPSPCAVCANGGGAPATHTSPDGRQRYCDGHAEPEDAPLPRRDVVLEARPVDVAVADDGTYTVSISGEPVHTWAPTRADDGAVVDAPRAAAVASVLCPVCWSTTGEPCDDQTAEQYRQGAGFHAGRVAVAAQYPLA